MHFFNGLFLQPRTRERGNIILHTILQLRLRPLLFLKVPLIHLIIKAGVLTEFTQVRWHRQVSVRDVLSARVMSLAETETMDLSCTTFLNVNNQTRPLHSP